MNPLTGKISTLFRNEGNENEVIIDGDCDNKTETERKQTSNSQTNVVNLMSYVESR